jgi:hypothetical protein
MFKRNDGPDYAGEDFHFLSFGKFDWWRGAMDREGAGIFCK